MQLGSTTSDVKLKLGPSQGNGHEPVLLRLVQLDCCRRVSTGRGMLMVNVGLLAALENAIGHTETHMTQLRAIIDECRSAGYRFGYHACLLLGAQDRLDRLRTRHARELEDLAVLRYAG